MVLLYPTHRARRRTILAIYIQAQGKACQWIAIWRMQSMFLYG
ncbi:hypothetical protein ApDm4_0809 [Acetobacter pomorum]|nr:hypothetical protein ApDm4_0809 [Acetobacter pomorum]